MEADGGIELSFSGVKYMQVAVPALETLCAGRMLLV